VLPRLASVELVGKESNGVQTARILVVVNLTRNMSALFLLDYISDFEKTSDKEDNSAYHRPDIDDGCLTEKGLRATERLLIRTEE